MDFLSKYTADILENLELVLLCFIGFQFAGKFIKVVVTLLWDYWCLLMRMVGHCIRIKNWTQNI